jgi:hypothetical protein
MDNPNEVYGEGFRHRRPPILVATGAHSEGFAPVERASADRPIEMSRLLARPSVDIEVNDLSVIHHEQNARSGLSRLHHEQWNGSDAESLLSQAAASSNFSR